LLRIFLISVFLIFSSLAFGKYISFLDPKSEFIISKYLGKKFLIGNANYSFLFWDIYDAELYSTSKKYNSNELAIILKYNRSIDKETLIRETINDIKEQKSISNQQEEKWKSLLESIYVDTKTNKKFIAIKINNKSIFYYNNKKLHESFDEEFNQLFFDIWLRSNSKNPNFTKTLLGQ
jgi:hypothetical protein